RLWDVTTRQAKGTFKGHTAAVRAVAFAPDGTPASAAEDGTVRLWPADGKVTITFQDQSGQAPVEFVGLAFAGPRTLVAIAADGILRVWDTVVVNQPTRMSGHPGGITGLAVVPGGLVTAGEDREVKRWRHADPG